MLQGENLAPEITQRYDSPDKQSSILWQLLHVAKLTDTMSQSSFFLASLLTFVLLQKPCTAQDSLLLQRQQLSLYKPYFSRQGISLDNYAFDNATINAKLLEVPRNDQKVQNKLVGAGLLAGLGIGLMTLAAVSKPNDNSLQKQVESAIGNSFLFTLGLASTAVAIPLGASSVKYRKQRDMALAEAKAYLMHAN